MAAYLSVNGHVFFNILWPAALKADNQFQINNKITRQYLISLILIFSLKALRWRRQRLCSFCIYPSLQNVSILNRCIKLQMLFLLNLHTVSKFFSASLPPFK